MAITVKKKHLEALGLKAGDNVSVEVDEGKNQIVIKPSLSGSQLVLELKTRPRLGGSG